MQEDWDVLSTFFPADWRDLAVESGALKGLRKDKSADGLLRVLLMHLGCGHSLRETVARARQAGLADLSDVARSGCASRGTCTRCAWRCSRTASRSAWWTRRW